MPELNKNAITLLASISGVNMNLGTAQILYVVPATVNGCIIAFIIIRNASVPLTLASYSFGFDASGYYNVVSDSVHTEIAGTTSFVLLTAKAGAIRGGPGDILNILLNTLQGYAATATIDVFGYLY
jgi:hypothetical protein